jgi:hypothetical protein
LHEFIDHLGFGDEYDDAYPAVDEAVKEAIDEKVDDFVMKRAFLRIIFVVQQYIPSLANVYEVAPLLEAVHDVFK